MSRRPAASYKPQTPACPAIHLQICTFVFSHFHDAPPAPPFLSTLCIVAWGCHWPSNFLFQSSGNSKSFICHRSKELPANSFACHTSKTGLPQVLCLPHFRPPSPRSACAGLRRQPQSDSVPRMLRLFPFDSAPTAPSQTGRTPC